MYKEMLQAMVNGVTEETAKEIFMKISAADLPTFDPRKPLDPDARIEVTSLEEKLDRYFKSIDNSDNNADSVNGKIFKSDHEARTYLRANGFNEDSMGSSWIKGMTVAHIIFKSEDRFRKIIDSRNGYEIITQ